jgi:hypothetical protein
MTGPALVIFMHKRDNPHTHTHTHTTLYLLLMLKAKTAKPCKGQTLKKQLTESVTSTSVIVKLSIVVISGECSDRYIVAGIILTIGGLFRSETKFQKLPTTTDHSKHGRAPF